MKKLFHIFTWSCFSIKKNSLWITLIESNLTSKSNTLFFSKHSFLERKKLFDQIQLFEKVHFFVYKIWSWQKKDQNYSKYDLAIIIKGNFLENRQLLQKKLSQVQSLWWKKTFQMEDNLSYGKQSLSYGGVVIDENYQFQKNTL